MSDKSNNKKPGMQGNAQGNGDRKNPSNEDWRKRKSSQSIEKGAIEELPIINYSNSKLDPHKFEQIKEALKTYIGQHYGWNNYIIDNAAEYTFPDVALPNEAYTDENDPTRVLREDLLARVKANRVRKEKYDDNKPIVYSILWGQCSSALKMKLKESPLFTMYERNRDPLELWKQITKHCTTYSSHLRNSTLAQIEAKRSFDNTYQRSDESIGEYYDRFNAAVSALQSSGYTLVNIEMGYNDDTREVEYKTNAADVYDLEQKHLAITFLRSLDKKRHGALLNELENFSHLGDDKYPATLVGAYELASRRRDINSSKLADEVRVVTNNQQNNYKGIGFNTTNSKKKHSYKNYNHQGNKNNQNKQHEQKCSGKNCEEAVCYLCNEKGHYRKDCPWISKAKELMEQGKSVSNTHVTYDNAKPSFASLSSNSLSTESRRPGFPVHRKFTFMGEQGDKLKNNWILLDNQSTVNVFCNKKFLRNMRKTDDKLEVSGIVDGESFTTQWIGEFDELPFPVYYHPKAAANILCFYDVREHCANLEFTNSDNSFTVTNYSGNTLVFNSVPNTKLYVFDAVNYKKAFPIVRTVQGMKERYTQEEVDRADKALELIVAMGRPTSEVLIDALKRGAILDCPLTVHDVRRMEKIYGKELGSIKGKTTRSTPSAIRFEHEEESSSSEIINVDRKITLCVDIFFIAGIPFLLSTSRRISLLMVEHLSNRTTETIMAELDYMINNYAKFGFEVSVILWDGEGAFAALEPWLVGKGIIVNPASKGEHVPDIERAIRTVKERVRSYIVMLPYRICLPILTHLVYFCVTMINSFPKKGNTVADTISPRELVTGYKPNYKLYTSALFGDYCQVYDEATKNDMTPRTTGAICIGPTGAAQGGMYFLLLRSWRVVVRRKFQKLPIPNEVIDLLNEKADRVGLHENLDLDYEDNDYDDDDDDDDEVYPEDNPPPDDPHGDEEYLVDQPVANVNNEQLVILQPQQDTIPNNLVAAEIPEPEIEGVENDFIDVDIPHMHNDAISSSTTYDLHDIISEPITTATNEEQSDEEETTRLVEEVMDTINPHANERYRLRQRNQIVNYQDWESDYERRKARIFTTYNMRKGLAELKLPAVVAALKEINQLIEKKVFDFVTPVYHVRRAAIHVFMFLKVKRDTTVKARAVANGAQQDLPAEQTSSPTIATEALLITLVFDIMDGCIVVTVDIEGAFLHALIMDDIYIVFDELCTSFIVDLLGDGIAHLIHNGKIYAKLNKALYGLVQAPRLFYLHLCATLKELGLIQNLYEPCVFKKLSDDKKYIILTVTIHVDDLKISGKNQEDVDWLVNSLRNKYGKLNCHTEKVIDYLGMVMDFSRPGLLQLSLKTMLKEVIDDYAEEVKVSYSTPAKNSLFETDENSKILDHNRKEKFHSTVQKLLYIGKHGRPDILLAIGFLTTRVNVPTEEDFGKLVRVVGYLRGTLDLVLTYRIPPRKTESCNVFEAYIDASYGVHVDMKSHSGLAIFLYGNIILCKSKKEKLNVKSSTEAEVVAVADYLPDILWVKQFMEDLRGNDCSNPVIIYQDNLSAKEIENAGAGKSNRTRHMNIRYFFVKDRVENREVTILYKCTEEMLADFFTKPLQGKRFEEIRDLIMQGTMW